MGLKERQEVLNKTKLILYKHLRKTVKQKNTVK